MKNGKQHRTKGTELLNQDKIRTHGKMETGKYFEQGTIKYAETKEKVI